MSGCTGQLSSSLETTWQTAGPLIADVRTELVNVTPTQISVASKSSALMSFIQLEARTLSQQIQITSAFIDDLEQVLAGRMAADPPSCDALKAIISHRMPRLDSLLPNAASSHQALCEWIGDVRQRLTRLPQGDVDDHVFQMSDLCHPEGFLDAALRQLARQQFKSLHSVYLTADVVRCAFCR